MRFAMVGLLAVHGCGFWGGDCDVTRTETMTISTPADPPMQFRIERCELDENACSEVCILAMMRNGIIGEMQRCEVRFESDRVLVEVEYGSSSGEPICGDGTPDDM